MRVEDLRDLLLRSQVPDDAYTLDEGAAVNEAYVLARDGGEWTVYYSERGRRTDERRFDSEDGACTEMLRRLQRDFPNQPAVQPWPKWVRSSLIAAFAAVVVYGLTSLRSGVDSAVVRIVVSVGVASLLATLLRTWRILREARRNRPTQRSAWSGNEQGDPP